MQLAPSLHRLGDGLVNSYLVEDAGLITIIDAGVPGSWGDLVAELAAMGRSIEDVRALLLTHGHSDHIGFAERFRRERGAVPRVHELDAALARGEVPNPARGLGPVKARPLLEFLLWGIRRGALRTPRLSEVASFGDGATLDLPGTPRVIHLPGHTPGSAAIHVAGLGALFVGDAIATKAVTTGAEGPQIAPFTADAAQALASLDRLEGLEASWLLPGHGQAWTGGVAEAVRLVRERSVGPGAAGGAPPGGLTRGQAEPRAAWFGRPRRRRGSWDGRVPRDRRGASGRTYSVGGPGTVSSGLRRVDLSAKVGPCASLPPVLMLVRGLTRSSRGQHLARYQPTESWVDSGTLLATILTLELRRTSVGQSARVLKPPISRIPDLPVKGLMIGQESDPNRVCSPVTSHRA